LTTRGLVRARSGGLASGSDAAYDHQMDVARVVEVLQEVKALLAQTSVDDFAWSAWEDSTAAISEIDRLLEQLPVDPAAGESLALLFAPTGALQEVGLSGGWRQEYLDLAACLDAAITAPGSR
jgi:hypothetical protein